MSMTAEDKSSGASPDFMVTEANHRIANSLTLIACMVQMQAAEADITPGAVPAPEVARLLRDVGARVQTVGLLHRLLSQQPGRSDVDIGQFLRDVCDALRQSFDFAGILDVAEIESSCAAPAECAGALALAVGELVTNAIKYAHPTGVPGVIAVGCHRAADGALVIAVADDGVGLPEKFDPDEDGGVGFRLVRALARQAGARTEYGSTDLGLTVRLILPAGAGQPAGQDA